MDEKLYSIGQASKICDVSQRMLRYYEEIGLITPDRIAQSSHYRYYGIHTMRRVQIIRYLIAEGFSLDEIKKVVVGEDVDQLQKLLLQKMEQTQKEVEYYYQRMNSLRAWYGLLVEGKAAYRQYRSGVVVKYIPQARYFYYTRRCEPEEKNHEDHLATEYYTLSKHDGHSMVDTGGAFHIYYDSYQERMEETYRQTTLLQTVYPHSTTQSNTMTFGGFLAMSAYHVGPLSTVKNTYLSMLQWAKEHEISLRGDCFERHVLDVDSMVKSENYVTELLLPVEEDTAEYKYLERWELPPQEK